MTKLTIEVDCGTIKCENCSKLEEPPTFSREDRYYCGLFDVWVGRNAERCQSCLAAEKPGTT